MWTVETDVYKRQSFVICRILEKRQLDFDRISQKLRLFISIFALIPLYWWINTGCPYIIEEISRSRGKFLRFGLGIIYIMVLVPGAVVPVSYTHLDVYKRQIL